MERAEKRAAALGITNTSKFPLSEFNYDVSGSGSSGPAAPPKSPGKKSVAIGGTGTYTKTPKKRYSPAATGEKSPGHPKETVNVTRKQSSGSGKDVDVAVEINITTGSNVQVSFVFVTIYY